MVEKSPVPREISWYLLSYMDQYALKCSVRKKRRFTGIDAENANYSIFDVEQLVADVLSGYDAYPSESLEEMWKYKQWVMGVVARSGGSNTYDRHRK